MSIRYSLPEKSMSECKGNLTFANLYALEREALAVAKGTGNTARMLMALPSIAYKFAKANDNAPIRPTSMCVSAEEPILLFGLSQGKMGYSVVWLDPDAAWKIIPDVNANIDDRLYMAQQLINRPDSDYSDRVEFRGNFTPEQLKTLGFKTAKQTTTPANVASPEEAMTTLAKSLGIDLATLQAALQLAKETAPVVEPVPAEAKTPKTTRQNRK